MIRKYRYEIEWENNIIKNLNKQLKIIEFYEEFNTEFEAVTYAINWMLTNDIDSSNLMYCRVEEVFDSEMRTNVLLWIGE